MQSLVQSRYLLPLEESLPLLRHLIAHRRTSSAVGLDELKDCRFVAGLDDTAWVGRLVLGESAREYLRAEVGARPRLNLEEEPSFGDKLRTCAGESALAHSVY